MALQILIGEMKMRRKMLSLLVGIFLAVVTLFGTACSDQPTPVPPDDGVTVWTPETIRQRPVTENDLLIGSYVSLSNSTLGQSSREQIKRLADGGLNFMPLASCISSADMIDQGERMRRDLSSLDWWKRIDEVMQENNMVYYFSTRPALGTITKPSAARRIP